MNTTKLKNKIFTFMAFLLSKLFKSLKWLTLSIIAFWTACFGLSAGIVGATVIQDIYGPNGAIVCLMFAYLIGGISFAVGQKFFTSPKEATVDEKTRLC